MMSNETGEVVHPPLTLKLRLKLTVVDQRSTGTETTDTDIFITNAANKDCDSSASMIPCM